MEFKDRFIERKEIQEILDSNSFEFLVLYGRRRVGKTELILNAIQKRKALYYFAVAENNLQRFYETCKSFDPFIANLRMDFEVLIEYLQDKIDVLVIDEFQEMIKENKNVLNLFQALIDTKLKNSTLKLIILGSSISMIHSKVLSYQSPLYGRKTHSIHLKPVQFFDVKHFFPEKSIQELVEIYGFADGIPFYLIKLDSPLWEFLQKEFSQVRGFLKDEVQFLMKYEFEDTSTYKLILEAIANGKTKLHDIKDFMKVSRTDLSPYLQNLIDVGFIKREVPITANMKSREGRYYLKDNFLQFWFRYVYPNLSAIESRAFHVRSIQTSYPQYLGFIFEQICQEFLIRSNKFEFQKIGRWWHKGEEIDIVAMNDDSKEILFGECKWQENVDAEKIYTELQRKSSFVVWNNSIRKVRFVIFAKSFTKKIRRENVSLFDLEDFSKLV